MSMAPHDIIKLTRRDFLVNTARGVGGDKRAGVLKSRADRLNAAQGAAFWADPQAHLRSSLPVTRWPHAFTNIGGAALVNATPVSVPDRQQGVGLRRAIQGCRVS